MSEPATVMLTCKFPEPTDNTYHCVEYSTSLGAKEHVCYFTTKEDALAFADEVRGLGKKFPCIWISIYAEYENSKGNWNEGWVYYWWSPEVAVEWDATPDPGIGCPNGLQYLTPYRPLRAS